MAVNQVGMTFGGAVARSVARIRFVMPGWHPHAPAAGDLVVIKFASHDVTARDPGWVQATSQVFCKTIGPGEPDALFTVGGTDTSWEAVAVNGVPEP